MVVLEDSSIFGAGFLNGGLHALSGIDHLAAILPLVVGRQKWRAGYRGFLWSLGHGMPAYIMGYVGYALKESITTNASMKTLTDMSGIIVGLTLATIGITGIYDIQLDNYELQSGKYDPRSTKGVKSPSKTPLSIFLNGFLMGFSWDSLPSLAPALALSDFSELFIFLSSYVVGTVIFVTIFAAVVGECTAFMANAVSNLSAKMSFVASVTSVIVGTIWLTTAIRTMMESQPLHILSLCTTIAAGAPLLVLGAFVPTAIKKVFSS